MNLKKYFEHTALLAGLILVMSCILVSCEKTDSSAAFGFSTIYIPQSTVSGGVNLNYLVPSGLDTNTYNYKVDTKNSKVNVFLGVTRSGKAASDAYTVTIGTRADTINTLIANGLIKVNPNATKTVVLLPAAAYTLPSTVSVPAGQYAASFNLSIDLAQLKAFAGKKVALCVTIASPTNYTLSSTNNKVVIIIDVDTLKLPV